MHLLIHVVSLFRTYFDSSYSCSFVCAILYLCKKDLNLKSASQSSFLTFETSSESRENQQKEILISIFFYDAIYVFSLVLAFAFFTVCFMSDNRVMTAG